MSRNKKTNSDALRQKAQWKVALYIRLSREDGNEISNSVLNQEARLRAFLEHFDEPYMLQEVYIDDGFTGTDTNRESFQRMIKHIREHKVNCVIVKDLSRLSRNTADAAHYLENLFVEYDVRFISLELPALDSYKNPDQMNSILVPIQNVINDDFCRQTSIKVRGVFNQKRKQGLFIGAFAPYGYQKDPENKYHLIIDEEASQVVRDIFHWYAADGLSKQAVTIKLNAMGIPNPTQYKHQKGIAHHGPHSQTNSGLWNHFVVTNILKNQVYTGDMVQGRQKYKSYKVHKLVNVPEEEWFVVADMHQPIITREIFEKTQLLIQQNTCTPRACQEVYMFAGFCRCADCKGPMAKYKGSKYSYYRCKTYYETAKNMCFSHAIRIDVLEAMVLKAIKKQIEMTIALTNIIEEINTKQRHVKESDRLSKLIHMHENEMKELIDQKDSLHPDWKKGFIDQEEYLRLKSKYDKKIQSTKQSLENVQKIHDEALQNNNLENKYLRAFITYQNITELNRSVICDLIKVIYIHGDGDVEIHFNFDDQYQVILDFIGANQTNLVS